MLRLEIEIDTSTGEIIGTKEAVMQALEQFGEVRVKKCDALPDKPEQTTLYGRKRA
jgi:hypothetical protein